MSDPRTSAAESLGTLAARALRSLAVWAKAGFPVVEEATLRQRIAACEGCPLLVKNPDRAIYKVVGEPVCGACGCLVTAKARLASERCAHDRWER
jgi:hypothetical protein